MLDRSRNSNLLEQDPYRYTLQDVDEPALFRQIYPYDEIPKVVFNHRRVARLLHTRDVCLRITNAIERSNKD